MYIDHLLLLLTIKCLEYNCYIIIHYVSTYTIHDAHFVPFFGVTINAYVHVHVQLIELLRHNIYFTKLHKICSVF